MDKQIGIGEANSDSDTFQRGGTTLKGREDWNEESQLTTVF